METMRPEPIGTPQHQQAVIHASQAGLVPPAPRPTSPGDEQLSNLLGLDPDSCPESLRAMVQTRATLDTSHNLLGELEYRLAHVLVDPEPSSPMDPGPVTHTPVGQYGSAMYGEAVRLERRLRDLLGRIRGV